MHSDLLMLRVACRVVEGAAPPSATSAATSSTSATAGHDAKRFMLPPPPDAAMRMPRLVLPTLTMSTASSSADARRIPALRIQRPPPPSSDAAGIVLGLKRQRSATHHNSSSDDDDDDDRTPRLKRSRGAGAPPPPGVFMDSPLAKLVHAQRPAPPMYSPLGVEGVPTPTADDKSQPRAAPATLVSFLSRPPQPQEKLSPLESPRASTLRTEPATTNALRVPSLAPWRGAATASPPQQASPLPSLASCRSQSAAMPPLALPTTKPTLVRKSSAPWRENMPATDRARTRERVLRGLDRQCRGDYEALLRIVTALDEELLHAHTTSKDHYFFQTVALRDRVATLAPPRTAHPDHV